MMPGVELRRSLFSRAIFGTLAFLCAGQVAALGQVSPCGLGQQLGGNAVITSGSPVYWSGSYVSGSNLNINVTGNSIGGSANVTVQAGTAVCLGPGFHAAGTSNGGRVTVVTGSAAPAGTFSVATTSLPAAAVGSAYSQALFASGGSIAYNWSLTAGSLPAGLTLSAAGSIGGNPVSGGNYSFSVQVRDAAGAIATQPLSLAVASSPAVPSLSINGGSSAGETLATITVPFAFGLYDQAGANDIGYAQFYLADSAGNAHCMGDWGRPNALLLYDGNTGVTTGFGAYQADSFCTVSLASITNSPTDPTEATVVLNFTFNPGYSGTYTVMEQVDYVSGAYGPWQSLGSLTIDPPPSLSSQPTVTLTDNTQSSGYYFAGDSFTLTVAGPATPVSLPVSVSLGGVNYGVQGYTNGSGNLVFNGSWTGANVGSYAETWYVDGVTAGPILLFSVLPAGDTSGPASLPNSFTAVLPQLPCNDITGNWIIA